MPAYTATAPRPRAPLWPDATRPLPDSVRAYVQNGAAEGGRNAALYRAAQQFNACGYTSAEAEGWLTPRALADGLKPVETRTTIRSAYRSTKVTQPLGIGSPASTPFIPSARPHTPAPPPAAGASIHPSSIHPTPLIPGSEPPAPSSSPSSSFVIRHSDFLSALHAAFDPEDPIAIVDCTPREDGDWKPGAAIIKTRAEWERWYNKMRDIGKLVGGTPGGAFIGINPLRPGVTSRSNDHIAAYRHVLVEWDGPADGSSRADQRARIEASRLPVSVLVDSGKKSIHAWVRVDAPNQQEWETRRDYLFRLLHCDDKNSDPARVSRCPTALRVVNGEAREQKLLATNIGAANWAAWVAEQTLVPLPCGERLGEGEGTLYQTTSIPHSTSAPHPSPLPQGAREDVFPPFNTADQTTVPLPLGVAQPRSERLGEGEGTLYQTTSIPHSTSAPHPSPLPQGAREDVFPPFNTGHQTTVPLPPGERLGEGEGALCQTTSTPPPSLIPSPPPQAPSPAAPPSSFDIRHSDFPTLPPLLTLKDLAKLDPKPTPEVIHGVLNMGCKMLIAGPSKARKSWVLLDLCLAVALGRSWLGHETTEGKCLFVNFELADWMLWQRIERISTSRGMMQLGTKGDSLSFWNLRGRIHDLAQLTAPLIEAVKTGGFSLVVLDPIYKGLGDRDENAAGDINHLLNELEQVCRETGAALAFSHHFAKGNSQEKATIDRMSGSGVWARDPDAIVTLTPPATPPPNKKHKPEDEPEHDLDLELTLRAHPPQEPARLYWKGGHFESQGGQKFVIKTHREGSYADRYGPLIRRMPPLERNAAEEWLHSQADIPIEEARKAFDVLKHFKYGLLQYDPKTKDWMGIDGHPF